MSSFKVGDRVVVIDGLRKGAVTVITSPLRAYLGRPDTPEIPKGTGVHELDLVSIIPGCRGVVAPPEWLRHYREGWEKAEWCDLTKRLCQPKREDA